MNWDKPTQVIGFVRDDPPIGTPERKRFSFTQDTKIKVLQILAEHLPEYTVDNSLTKVLEDVRIEFNRRFGDQNGVIRTPLRASLARWIDRYNEISIVYAKDRQEELRGTYYDEMKKFLDRHEQVKEDERRKEHVKQLQEQQRAERRAKAGSSSEKKTKSLADVYTAAAREELGRKRVFDEAENMAGEGNNEVVNKETSEETNGETNGNGSEINSETQPDAQIQDAVAVAQYTLQEMPKDKEKISLRVRRQKKPKIEPPIGGIGQKLLETSNTILGFVRQQLDDFVGAEEFAARLQAEGQRPEVTELSARLDDIKQMFGSKMSNLHSSLRALRQLDMANFPQPEDSFSQDLAMLNQQLDEVRSIVRDKRDS